MGKEETRRLRFAVFVKERLEETGLKKDDGPKRKG